MDNNGTQLILLQRWNELIQTKEPRASRLSYNTCPFLAIYYFYTYPISIFDLVIVCAYF